MAAPRLASKTLELDVACLSGLLEVCLLVDPLLDLVEVVRNIWWWWWWWLIVSAASPSAMSMLLASLLIGQHDAQVHSMYLDDVRKMDGHAAGD